MISPTQSMTVTAKRESDLPMAEVPELAKAAEEGGLFASAGISPFAVVFDGAQALAASVRQGQAEGGSAALMFDADVNDAHGRRLSSGQSADRAALDANANNPMNRTGVDARRQVSSEFSNASSDRATPNTSASDRELMSQFDRLRDLNAAQRNAPTQPMKSDPNGESLGQKGHAIAQSTQQVDEPGRAQQASMRANPFAATNAAASAKSATVQGAAKSGGSSPAEQVGRILGAPKAGSVNSAPMAEAGASNGARALRDRSELAPHKPAADQSPSKPDSSRESEGSGRSQAASRTPFDELVQSLRLQSGSQRSSARMWLHPPELGKLHIDVRIEQDTMRIRVRTDNEKARGLVSDRADILKEALAGHGLRVEEFEVVYDREGEMASEQGDRIASDEGGPSEAPLHSDSRRTDVDRERSDPTKLPGDDMIDRKSKIDIQHESVVTESRLDILI